MASFSLSAAPRTGPVEFTFKCVPNTGNGDPVYFSRDADETVEPATTNTTTHLVIGIVREKPAADEAMVVTLGAITAGSGLRRGYPVFITPSGAYTTELPATGNIQIIGIAMASNRIYVCPQPTMIVRQ